MRLYLLGIAAAALVLLTSFVLREKNRAELQLQQQNDALAAAAQSVDAELSGCCSTIAQFINNPDLKKYASATERDLQAEVELTYYIYRQRTTRILLTIICTTRTPMSSSPRTVRRERRRTPPFMLLCRLTPARKQPFTRWTWMDELGSCSHLILIFILPMNLCAAHRRWFLLSWI